MDQAVCERARRAGQHEGVIVRLLACLLLLTGCGDLAKPEPEGPLTGERLVEALQEGGLVLYLRHTATEEDAPDGVPTDPCADQRGLTEAGRADARQLGKSVAELGIEAGRVVASPYCRTVETAELAFGRTDTDDALLPIPSGRTPGTGEAKDQLRELLSTEPADGAITILVGHVSNLRPVADATPEEGGTVIFRPDGDGRFRIVAEVPPGGWQRLAERHR